MCLRVIHTPEKSSAYKPILKNNIKIWILVCVQLENDPEKFTVWGKNQFFV